MNITRCPDCVCWEVVEIGKGNCLRKSPSIFPVPTPQGLGFMTVFPQTTRESGCAEGEQKVTVLQ